MDRCSDSTAPYRGVPESVAELGPNPQRPPSLENQTALAEQVVDLLATTADGQFDGLDPR